MFLAAMAGTFLVPIYYRARARGYNAPLLTWLAGAIAAIWFLLFIRTGDPIAILLTVAVPAGFLLALLILPARPGALGPISFPCPNCHQTVALPRRKAGLTGLCPQCGETLTVPDDTQHLGTEEPSHPRPAIVSGPVEFARFDDEVEAERLVNALLDNDVRAEIARENTSGVLPPITRARSRVVIDATDWERAVEIERSLREKRTRR